MLSDGTVKLGAPNRHCYLTPSLSAAMLTTCDVLPTGKQVQLFPLFIHALLVSQDQGWVASGSLIAPSSSPSPPLPHPPGDLSMALTSFVTALPMIVSQTTDSVDDGHLQPFPFPLSPTASSAQTPRMNSMPVASQFATLHSEPIPTTTPPHLCVPTS